MKTRQWILLLFISAVTAIFIRMFVFETIRVASFSMSETLKPGDRLIVEKLSLGARLPMALGLPFMPDSTPFGRTYLILGKQANRVHGFGDINRNELIAFNEPDPNPTYSRNPVLLSRCVGLPGEILESNEGDLHVQGKKIQRPADETISFSIPKSSFKELIMLLARQNITRGLYKKKDTGYLYLTRTEWLKIHKDSRYDSLELHLEAIYLGNCKLRIPARGMQIPLNDSTLSLYGNLIEKYENVTLRRCADGTILKNGHKSYRYIFKCNYYFFLNDHQGYLNDSRSLGLIPEQLILGKVNLVLFSPSDKRFLHKI
jgi:signal peptidase I